MAWREHIREAAAILAREDLSFHQRFSKAASHFWSAINDIPEWPPAQLEQANEILDGMLALNRAAQRSPHEADEAAARVLAERIVQLARDLDAAPPEA